MPVAFHEAAGIEAPALGPFLLSGVLLTINSAFGVFLIPDTSSSALDYSMQAKLHMCSTQIYIHIHMFTCKHTQHDCRSVTANEA